MVQNDLFVKSGLFRQLEFLIIPEQNSADRDLPEAIPSQIHVLHIRLASRFTAFPVFPENARENQGMS